ncbi:MAG: extracellular solute-binding protein [Chloroflexota bacterium]
MSHKLSRRDFLKALGMGAGATALAACAPAATETTVPPTATKPPVPTEAPTQAPTEAPVAQPLFGHEFAKNKEQWARLPGDHQFGSMVSQADWYKMLGDAPKEALELALFKGGFGDGWGEIFTQLMEKEHPGVKLNLTFDPTIWDKVQPKLIAGEVPEFMFYAIGSWGGDWKKGVEEHLVMPGDFLLDLEAYGSWKGQRVGDLFNTGVLAEANQGLTDHQWSFPQTSFTYGIFYNVDLFEQNGWPAPDTLSWEDFMKLHEEIAKVLPPWAYAGLYNYEGWLTTGLLYKTLGDKAWMDCHNLVPGAFLNEKLIWAAEQHQQIIQNGWSIPGSDAMDHTSSQQLFVDGKAAMIPNGSWLASEQASTTPAGFRMKFAGVPKPKDGLGDNNAVQGQLGGADMQIGNAMNPLWGMELMRLFYSPEMAEFWGSKVGSPLPLKDAASGKVTEYSASITEAVKKANGKIIHMYFTSYPLVDKAYSENYADMVHGNMSAQEFFEGVERAAEETRNDSSIQKTEYKTI